MDIDGWSLNDAQDTGWLGSLLSQMSGNQYPPEEIRGLRGGRRTRPSFRVFGLRVVLAARNSQKPQ